VHLKTGFPWRGADRPHPGVSTPEAWWNQVGGLLENAVKGIGVDPDIAAELVPEVQAVFIDPQNWLLFEDMLPVLRQLSDMGWTDTVLANHAPGLPELVDALEIAESIDLTITSASIRYEKPHPGGFEAPLEAADDPMEWWSIGNSLAADVLGAEQAGIPAILVRRPGDSDRVAETLDGVLKWIRPPGAAAS